MGPVSDCGSQENDIDFAMADQEPTSLAAPLLSQLTSPEGKDHVHDDPFEPFDGLPDEQSAGLTLRAVAVGIACGALINASNIYVGLKSGWGASANIFASVVGFTVLRSCSRHFPHVAQLGLPFGPRENNIIQTTATAAGGMSNVFISAFPAMYQLGLFRTPREDFWRIASLTAVGGYFGLFFATPLRQFFIHKLARELGLIFPSSSATAATIRSMHADVGGVHAARRKTKYLGLAFLLAASLRILSQYAVGILWDWHLFTWLFHLGVGKGIALSFESWGWFVEWSPAFIGTGMLVGLNVSFSFLLGTVLAWGVIGPLLVATGICFGVPETADPQWSGYVSYSILSEAFTTADHSSPRYWLLWPGIACMIAVACTEILCQWRIFWSSGRTGYRMVTQNISSILHWTRSPDQETLSRTSSEETFVEKDVSVKSRSNEEDEEVASSMWGPGLILIVILTCIVMRKQFGVGVAETLLALFLSALFSLVAILASGATDVTPLTAVTKVSQVILGGSSKMAGLVTQDAQRVNLLGGALANIGANQAADLIGDYRVGYLLRTSPKTQWLAQSIGTAVAVLLAPAIYVLFATAYPCIHDMGDTTNCPFHAPSAAAWRAVAVAVTEPDFSIPPSSFQFAIIFALMGSISTLVRHFAWTDSRAWIRVWHPNMMVVALPFAIPTTVVGTAMVMGASGAAIWARYWPVAHEEFGHSIAAGLMAGEGIGGVVNAAIHVLGFSGAVYGTVLGCPAGKC